MKKSDNAQEAPSRSAPAAGAAVLSQEPKDEAIVWRSFLTWGWRVISLARSIFIFSLFLFVLNALIGIYQPLLVAEMVGGLQSLGSSAAPRPEAAGTAPSKASPGEAAKPTSDAATGTDAKKPAQEQADVLQRFFRALIPSSLTVLAWLLLAITAFKVLSDFFTQWAGAWADARIIERFQNKLHNHILSLGPSFHQANDLGTITAMVLQFSQAAQQMLCETYRTLPIQVFTFGFAVIALHSQFAKAHIPGEVMLSLVACVTLFPIIGWRLAISLRRVATGVREAMLGVQNEFMNSASAPMEVQAMDAVPQRSRAFSLRLAQQSKTKIKGAFYNTINSVFNSSASSVLQAVFVVYLLFDMPSDSSRLGEYAGMIVAVYLLIPQALRPVQQIISFFGGLNMCWPQVKSVIDLLETTPEIQDKAGAVDLVQGTPDIVLDNLSFAYRAGGYKVLDGITHTFPAGKISSIVAQAGKGKSTLLGLILRIREIEGGALRVGEQDIRDLTLASLRRGIVRVSQYPLFITGALRDNFRLARATATDADIEDACRKAGIWDQVLVKKARDRGIPNPLDLPFYRESGEGKEWSGGERRMMALARALLSEPSVVLLDEPTSGLDAVWAKEIAGMIRKAFAGKTVLLVDHLPEFVRQTADLVVCLDQGKFVDAGTPAELLARPSLFKSLLESLDNHATAPDDGAPDYAMGAAPTMAKMAACAPGMEKMPPKA